MLIVIISMLGIVTWVAAHLKFQVDAYSVGFHIHLKDGSGPDDE